MSSVGVLPSQLSDGHKREDENHGHRDVVSSRVWPVRWLAGLTVKGVTARVKVHSKTSARNVVDLKWSRCGVRTSVTMVS